MTHLNSILLSPTALTHNLNALRAHIGPKPILAPCIKANAYGHGLLECAKVFEQAGADWFCVNSVEEAVRLRKANFTLPILVIGYVPNDQLELALTHNLRLLVTNETTIKQCNNIAINGSPAIVHLKVDTGMSRQGVMPEEVHPLVRRIKELPNVVLEGIATHFATSDKPEAPAPFEAQFSRFQRVLNELAAAGINIPIKHCANSAATLLYPQTHLDLVRPGIACYGLWPSGTTKQFGANKIELQPALTLTTRVAYLKTFPMRTKVSYGGTFVTERETRVAILPIGYSDGVDRSLSNKGQVLINGQRTPILGRICMNIIIVDVTDVAGKMKVEDEVVLIGMQDAERITAEEVAVWAGTINYEITTRLRESMARIVID